jgi:DNA topoisomerase IB
MGRLRRVDCAGRGITRRRRGRGFEYLDREGERIADEEVLKRIRALAIPPAWQEVWICSDPLGHMQATGLDARGRKQYGHELLAYREARRWRDVRSEEINEYIKEAVGNGHSAKSFRTWNATVLAAIILAAIARERDIGTEGGRARAKRDVVRRVAQYLGNTPAVCRASYIDPRVFDRFDGGLTIGGFRAAAR